MTTWEGYLKFRGGQVYVIASIQCGYDYWGYAVTHVEIGSIEDADLNHVDLSSLSTREIEDLEEAVSDRYLSDLEADRRDAS